MIPLKYKEHNVSLLDNDECDYMFSDIVNYVLDEGQDHVAEYVSDLSDKQCRMALCIYVRQCKHLIEGIESVQEDLNRLKDNL